MSKMIGPGIFLAEEEPPGVCELCGKAAEVRPYGPKGEQVCSECMMKDEAAALRQFMLRLGNPRHIKVIRPSDS